MCWSSEAAAREAWIQAVAVEGGLFCTLRAKRCRRVRSPSLSVTAVFIPPAMVMVAPAPLMAWWQMAGRVVVVMVTLLVGQAAPGTQVDPELAP